MLRVPAHDGAQPPFIYSSLHHIHGFNCNGPGTGHQMQLDGPIRSWSEWHPGGEYYCSLCGVHVGKTSKHCRACDRCVEGFDHHCKWLNNCVGSKNYKHFFALVVSASALLTLQLAWALWLFISSFTQKGTMMDQVQLSYRGSVNYVGWQVMLVLYMLLLCGAVFMLGELLSFHLVLMSKEMTTYDFIVAQRDQLLTGGPPPPSTASSLCSLLVKGLKCECCKGRVHDEDTAAARRKAQVALNPCAACSTKKLEGNPHTWMLQGRTSAPLNNSPSKPANIKTPATPPALPAHLIPPGTPQTPTSVAAVEPHIQQGTPQGTIGVQLPVMEATASGGLMQHLQPMVAQHVPGYGIPNTWTIPAGRGSPQFASYQPAQYPITAASGPPSGVVQWYTRSPLSSASPHMLDAAHTSEQGPGSSGAAVDGTGARHLGSSPSARHSADRLPPLSYLPSPPSVSAHLTGTQLHGSPQGLPASPTVIAPEWSGHRDSFARGRH